MKQLKLALVPADCQAVQQAQQARERRARWTWCEAEVWTNRMLEALEKGVQGGKWFRLIDKVYASGNLMAAWKQVKANAGAAGVDGQSVQAFATHAEENLRKLAQELKENAHRPLDVRRHWIPKPGSNEQRPLGIPAVRDRVVQTALKAVLEPIFERGFAESSYGFRPGRGCKMALTRVDELLQQGYTWVVDADLKSYFDTIPHDKLMERVRNRVADGKVLKLIEAYLKAHVMDGLERWEPESGSPQGAVISPLLSNVYLDPLDHLMARQGFEMIRYADDFVVLCRTKEEAERALEQVRTWTVQAGLQLHPEKTRIVYTVAENKWQADGFDFLGFHFAGGMKTPRDKSLKKFKDNIREKTRRNSGISLGAIIVKLNRSLRGWFNYFRDSQISPMTKLDRFIRRRLRAILLRRDKKHGRGYGLANQRWPNAYFSNHGLLSLLGLREQYLQSLRGTC